MFFEGPEKKVELVSTGEVVLRDLGEDWWRAVALAAGAQILSVIRSDACDAYLLSESSLFVYDHRVIMLTCGQTTLARAVEMMVDRLGDAQVAMLIYERKNEHFPELQHTGFLDDARDIHRLLPGVAMRFGDPDSHRLMLFHAARPYTPADDDVTLEVLMHGISDEAARRFHARPGERVDGVAARTGIAELLPGFTLDEHLFEPAGYSMNALRGADYATIHVTPEAIGSYVSFETNVDYGASPEAMVKRVVEIFEPAAFDVITFSTRAAPALSLQDFTLVNHVEQAIACGYNVGFRHYHRPSMSPRRAFTLPL
ncbi:MAG: adenosylmethionine decarboxylase [Bradymonadia bacterium]